MRGLPAEDLGRHRAVLKHLEAFCGIPIESIEFSFINFNLIFNSIECKLKTSWLEIVSTLVLQDHLRGPLCGSRFIFLYKSAP